MTEEELNDLFAQAEENDKEKVNNQVELFNENNQLEHNTSWVIAYWINEIKKIEKKQEEMYEQIKVQMEQRGIKKFENAFISITYIEPTTRATFDSKSLKADNPELYAQYLKESDVKASVRIKAKATE